MDVCEDGKTEARPVTVTTIVVRGSITHEDSCGGFI
jgi:hypothetical protein